MPRSTHAYRSLLGAPGVPAQVALGLVAQMTQPVAPIGMVLVIESATGSLELAGLVVAALSVGIAMARPVQGRLIDRRGARPVAIACGISHTLALLALAATASAGASGALLVALGWATGASTPPISQSMRVDLARLAPVGGRTAAYSLAFLTQELSFLLGPLLFGAAIVVASPAPALALVAVVAGAGTLGYAAALRGDREATAEATGGGVFTAGMVLLYATVALLGASIGALEVGVPAFAAGLDAPAMAGVLIAALSVGGILGAVSYGARTWATLPATRLVALLLALGAALAPLAAFTSLPAAVSLPLTGAALFAAGIALNPALTTTSLLVDELAPAAPAEAFGWISTALGLGWAGGAAAAGVVGEQHGPGRVLVLASALSFAGAALALAIRGRARPRSVPAVPSWRDRRSPP